ESWSSVGSYSIEAEQDEKNIYDSLATINGVLSCYPDGFFTQLGSSPLQIGIVNDMRGVDVETVSQANGLTVDGDPGQMLLRSDANAKTVFHEIGHVIFNKLCRSGYQSQLMGDFNELNPRDFIYSFSYDADDPDYFKYTPFDSEPGERYENIYFSSDYAKISNTEDVAELMGNLMAEDEAPKLYMSVHLQEKCSFLFDLIRRVFDTSDWPEETFWEKRLSEAAAY
ncbi:MAG: hypothetical protein II713_03735, partial [Clostridia bacterium]|nr:hypothetical protein [Clostridia bacterium]